MIQIAWLRFFVQAEDGIRAGHVAGVQTCALPIVHGAHGHHVPRARVMMEPVRYRCRKSLQRASRSEERRVGNEDWTLRPTDTAMTEPDGVLAVGREVFCARLHRAYRSGDGHWVGH